MELIDTQVGKIVEQLKVALLSHIPIAYIPTNDMGLIHSILYSEETHGAIIPRLLYKGASSSSEELICLDANKFFEATDTGTPSVNDNYIFKPKFKIEDIKLPSIIVVSINDWSKLPDSVTEFIKIYVDIKLGVNYNKHDLVDRVRRSLCIVVTPSNEAIPSELTPYVKKIEIPILSDDEIRQRVLDIFTPFELSDKIISEDFLNEIIVSLRGFSSSKIQNLFDEIAAQQYIQAKGIDKNGIMSTIRNEKKAMMEDSPGLKWEKVGNVEAAGLSEITQYLEQRKEIFKDPQKASQKYIDVPKGILISGVPGSGKSLMAKTAASMLNLPLISLDMGAMLGSLMGQSEHNMIEALHMAEQMAPCVLWIDEIEKAFSASSQGASSGDSGVGRRMFGKFLTWMQEKSSACFVFATSNDISNLPPELFRSERFDRKYFTFMPTAHECAEIFTSIIRKENKDFREQLGIDKNPLLGIDSPISLFSKDAEKPEFWINILNRCCAKNGDSLTLVAQENSSSEGDYTKPLNWIGNVKPKFKLMTGADISALIKELKFTLSQDVLNKQDQYDGDCVYRANIIEYYVSNLFESDSFKPYGETNVLDIVKCFNKLYINQFVPASGSCILNFDNYSDEDMLYFPNGEILTERYDEALFYMLVGAINKYSKAIQNGLIK